MSFAALLPVPLFLAPAGIGRHSGQFREQSWPASVATRELLSGTLSVHSGLTGSDFLYQAL